jgi:hypothetical protein
MADFNLNVLGDDELDLLLNGVLDSPANYLARHLAGLLVDEQIRRCRVRAGRAAEAVILWLPAMKPDEIAVALEDIGRSLRSIDGAIMATDFPDLIARLRVAHEFMASIESQLQMQRDGVKQPVN